jgi:hypothetical protein
MVVFCMVQCVVALRGEGTFSGQVALLRIEGSDTACIR